MLDAHSLAQRCRPGGWRAPITGSLAALLGLSPPAWAENCRLALVLALDVSSSVDSQEDRLQRGGLAGALLAPEVVQAFLVGEPVALYVFEWSGPTSQVTMSPGWQMVDDQDDLARIAATVAARSWSGSAAPHRTTALGAALTYAASALQRGPSCQAQTIDVSGDGVNNQGPAPQAIYDEGLLDGVTVNALVIGGAQNTAGMHDDEDLVAWFEAHVLHGPGAFSVFADTYADYETAMREKLWRELEAPLVSGWPEEAPQG